MTTRAQDMLLVGTIAKPWNHHSRRRDPLPINGYENRYTKDALTVD
jgi:hypothetical protein